MPARPHPRPQGATSILPNFAKLDALTLLRPDGERLFSDLSLAIGAARYGLVGCDGYGKSTLLRLLAGALADVGLGGIDLGRATTGLSGGERIRLMIARALFDRPDLLLLDEPTNNMDEAGRAAVHALMAGWRGGLVVASHDRELLERVDRIVELTPQGVHVTAGGWSAHAAVRAARLERARARLDRAQAKVTDAADAARDRAEKQARRDAIGRRLRATGSAPKILMDVQKERAEGTSGADRRLAERQGAQARAELDGARAEIERLRPMSFSLPACGLPSSRQVLLVDGLTIRHAGGPTIGPVSFAITGPGRVALAGPNAAGKTSVLRAIAAGGRGVEGQVSLAQPVPPVLDQHLTLLDDGRTLLENIGALQPGLARNAAHATLARFAFRNTDADRRVGSLSGGERLRAALACVVATDPVPDLLLLDEPTNHLDLDSLEELEAALAGFDGALPVVSHDAGFLDRIGIDARVRLPGPG